MTPSLPSTSAMPPTAPVAPGHAEARHRTVEQKIGQMRVRHLTDGSDASPWWDLLNASRGDYSTVGGQSEITARNRVFTKPRDRQEQLFDQQARREAKHARALERKKALDHQWREGLVLSSDRWKNARDEKDAKVAQQKATKHWLHICAIVGLVSSWRAMKVDISHLEELKAKRIDEAKQYDASVTISCCVRYWYARIWRERYKEAIGVLKKHVAPRIERSRQKKKDEFATTIKRFLHDSQFSHVGLKRSIQRFRVIVLRCQRHIKSYLMCRRHRLQALSQMWHDLEVQCFVSNKEAADARTPTQLRMASSSTLRMYTVPPVQREKILFNLLLETKRSWRVQNEKHARLKTRKKMSLQDAVALVRNKRTTQLVVTGIMGMKGMKGGAVPTIDMPALQFFALYTIVKPMMLQHIRSMSKEYHSKRLLTNAREDKLLMKRVEQICNPSASCRIDERQLSFTVNPRNTIPQRPDGPERQFTLHRPLIVRPSRRSTRVSHFIAGEHSTTHEGGGLEPHCE